MSPAIYIERHGHRTWIKWHRGRRFISDAAFTGQRILEGMRLGASVEVDLVIHGEGGFAVLHDRTLERETTGHGLVREASAGMLRNLHLRGNDGAPIADNVMLLEDLCDRLAEEGVHPDAVLQLDFKEDVEALSPQVVANFAECVLPIKRHLIVSGGDFDAISTLAEATAGIATGYDPCDGGTLARLRANEDYLGFIGAALQRAPDAQMIYLDHRIVLAADDAGVDIVAPVHAAGRRVDAWTINTITPQSIDQIERLLRLNVDQITTDDPQGLARFFIQ